MKTVFAGLATVVHVAWVAVGYVLAGLAAVAMCAAVLFLVRVAGLSGLLWTSVVTVSILAIILLFAILEKRFSDTAVGRWYGRVWRTLVVLWLIGWCLSGAITPQPSPRVPLGRVWRFDLYEASEGEHVRILLQTDSRLPSSPFWLDEFCHHVHSSLDVARRPFARRVRLRVREAEFGNLALYFTGPQGDSWKLVVQLIPHEWGKREGYSFVITHAESDGPLPLSTEESARREFEDSWSIVSADVKAAFSFAAERLRPADPPPIFRIAEFMNFLNCYSAGHPCANCDGSTTPPLLDGADFICFQSKFLAGRPYW